ncbi:hypothetical protein NDU88_003075 [Pleurodeles waltl]|uniref:Uncharacterized protein n=1 Tax=Pleurodeles waltl TaxID=8319 RepID=A0AAV7QBX8_PLEWA|nr:hypothetical protein NDU88_003075 [Pleurodeles waltl]
MDSSCGDMVRPKTYKPPPPQKTIMAMLIASPVPVGPIRQLENTLEMHTGMFDRVLQAIQDSKTVMEAQHRAIHIDTGLLRADHAKLTERVDDAESSLTSKQPSQATLKE